MTTSTTPQIRELFIEELAEIHAGAWPPGGGNTTYACCEEGPFGCCGILDPILDPPPVP
jgi:hypothetical protein